jgi:hypothetical protein
MQQSRLFIELCRTFQIFRMKRLRCLEKALDYERRQRGDDGGKHCSLETADVQDAGEHPADGEKRQTVE